VLDNAGKDFPHPGAGQTKASRHCECREVYAIAALMWVWGMRNGPAPAAIGKSPWIRDTRSETALAPELVFMHLVVDAAWRDPEKSGRLRLIASRFLQSGL
jgi:hypothetical protein